MPDSLTDQNDAHDMPDAGSAIVANLSADPIPARLVSLARAMRRPLRQVRDVPTALAATPDAPALVLVLDPVHSAARAMDSGALPSEALATWLSLARGALPDLRRHRRRLVVLTPVAMDLPPDDLAGLLAPVLGRGAAPLADIDGPDASEQVPPSALSRLLARYLLQDTPGARDLAGEIWAMMPAHAAEGDSAGSLADAAFEASRRQEADAARLSGELDRLKATLALRRAELVAAEAQRRAGDEVAAYRESVLGAALLRRAAREATKDLEMAREQRPGGASDAEIARLRHQIAELHASTSWRITAPLRALGRVLRRR